MVPCDIFGATGPSAYIFRATGPSAYIFIATGPSTYFLLSAISPCQQHPPEDGAGVRVRACVRECVRACACTLLAQTQPGTLQNDSWLGVIHETGRWAVAAAAAAFSSPVCFHFGAKEIIVRKKIFPWIYSVLGCFANATRKGAN